MARLLRRQDRADAEHRPPRARGRALHARLRDHARLRPLAAHAHHRHVRHVRPARCTCATAIHSKEALARDPAAYDNIPVYEAVPPPQVRCFPELLRAAGYYATNNAKEDYQFRAPPTAWDESSRQGALPQPQAGPAVLRGLQLHVHARVAGVPERAEAADVVKAAERARSRRTTRTPSPSARRWRRPTTTSPPWTPGSARSSRSSTSRPARFDGRHLLQRPRRRPAARQAQQLRQRPARAADRPLPGPPRRASAAGGGRSPGQLHRLRADDAVALRREAADLHEGPPLRSASSSPTRRPNTSSPRRTGWTRRWTWCAACSDGRYRYIRNLMPQVPHLPLTHYRENLVMMKDLARLKEAGKGDARAVADGLAEKAARGVLRLRQGPARGAQPDRRPDSTPTRIADMRRRPRSLDDGDERPRPDQARIQNGPRRSSGPPTATNPAPPPRCRW